MSLSTYAPLIEYLKHTPDWAGDILEIGALVGHGTRQLAEAWPDRLVWALDVFDTDYDKTLTQDGLVLAELYRRELPPGVAQRAAFDHNTADLPNVRVIVGDSRDATFPPGRLWLVIIDGGHSPGVVLSDWFRAAGRGPRYVAFHDYRHDLPEVTRVIDAVTEGLERVELSSAWLVVRI